MQGSYCLIIGIKKNVRVKIGALGPLEFARGIYVYVGSALNSLEKRIGRHLQKDKKKHWHVDYLLGCPHVVVKKVFHKESNRKEECQIASQIASQAAAIIKFGSSDCRCRGHLFRIPAERRIKWSAYGLKPYNFYIFG